MSDAKKELTEKVARLEELNRDLMGMIENSYDALTILDGEGRHLHLSPAFERVTGTKIADILGRKMDEVPGEKGTDPGASAKVIETGRPQTVIVNTRHGRQVLSTAVPVFDEKGAIVRIYCNLRDITELNQLKARFEQSQTLVNKYLVELHEVKQHQTMQSQFVAHSSRMKQILEVAHRIARVDATVLILGESGVGKELVARIVHEASPRAETGTFVKINCGAIPGDLLESELFGYDGGAFTGAGKDGKPGYFEIADNGTLLLDEIGDLPLKLQVKILSVLQDQEVTRLGGTRPKKVDVRIIAATNRDLETMVATGAFREDLFYRLNVVPLFIPALRERREDIPFLLVHYLDVYNRKYGLYVRMSKDVIDSLCAYRWPGNVRELANLVERLAVTTNEQVLLPEHLPARYACEAGQEDGIVHGSLRQEVERFELGLIKKTLDGSTTLEEAAVKLGISLSTLTRRIRMLKKKGLT